MRQAVKFDYKVRSLKSSLLVSVTFVSQLSLVAHARLHLNVLGNGVLASGFSIILEYASFESNRLHAAIVKFFEGAVESDANISRGIANNISLTSDCRTKQTSVVLSFSESILKFKRVEARELFIKDLLRGFCHEPAASLVLSVSSNDALFEAVLSISVVDCFELSVAEDCEGFAALVEFTLVYLHVGRIA